MVKRLLLPVVAAMALAAPAASADVTPAGDVLYVVGDMNGWDINNTNYVLPKVEEGVYKGLVNTWESYFRFFTVLGDYESNSIGSNNTGDNEEIEFWEGEWGGELTEGTGCWHIFAVQNPLIEMTVNLNDNQVYFHSVEIESIALNSAQELNFEGDTTFSFDGDAEVLLSATLTDGTVYTFGCQTNYGTEGVWEETDVMPADVNTVNFMVRPSSKPIVIEGCTSDNPVTLTFNSQDMMVKIRRSSFDPSKLVFELNEGNPDLVVGNGYSISQFINFDGELDWNEIYFDVVSGNVEQWSQHDFQPTEAGELTLAFYSNEIPDKRLEKTFTVLPRYPEAYNLYVRSGEWEQTLSGIVLAKDAEKEGMYLATVTIPEGDGDFEFMFGGTEEQMNHGSYQLSRSWESEEQMNLAGDLAQCRFEEGHTGMYFNIPAEFRGQTFVFRINFNERTLDVYREGYNPDIVNIVPAENNPEYAVKGRNTEFRFAVDRELNYGAAFEGSDYMWHYGSHLDYIDGQLYLVVNIYCPEDMPEDEFTLVIGKHENNGELTELYRQTIAVAFVELEGVELPEEITVCVGEFVKVYPVMVPENASAGYSWDSDNWYGYVEDFFGDNVTILGIQEGVVNYVVYDGRNGNELGRMTVRVLPKQAAVAEHIFHVCLEEGDKLNLNLSAHAARDYASATWTSSNEEVAIVDSEGNVTAVGNGYAVITADCGEHQAVMGIQVGGVSGIEDASAVEVKAYGHDGAIYVSGVKAGQAIKVYDVDGRMVGNATSTGSVAKFEVGKGVHVVAAGDRVFKLGM